MKPSSYTEFMREDGDNCDIKYYRAYPPTPNLVTPYNGTTNAARKIRQESMALEHNCKGTL